MTTPRLQALMLSDEPMEFFANDEPKCPHCGHTQSIDDNEWFELYEEGDHTVECPDCGYAFIVNTCVSYSFSTEDQPDEV